MAEEKAPSKSKSKAASRIGETDGNPEAEPGTTAHLGDRDHPYAGGTWDDVPPVPQNGG